MTTRTKIIVASGVFLFFAIPIAYGTYRPAVIKYISERREQKLIELSEKNAKSIEDAYRNDFDGGATPEETLELFLVALKEGNPEKASKYYELSVQPKALESLKKEVAIQGEMIKSVRYFQEIRSKGQKDCFLDYKKEQVCVFKYRYTTEVDQFSQITGTPDKILIPKGVVEENAIDLTRNSFTGVWKITFPI